MKKIISYEKGIELYILPEIKSEIIKGGNIECKIDTKNLSRLLERENIQLYSLYVGIRDILMEKGFIIRTETVDSEHKNFVFRKRLITDIPIWEKKGFPTRKEYVKYKQTSFRSKMACKKMHKLYETAGPDSVYSNATFLDNLTGCKIRNIIDSRVKCGMSMMFGDIDGFGIGEKECEDEVVRKKKAKEKKYYDSVMHGMNLLFGISSCRGGRPIYKKRIGNDLINYFIGEIRNSSNGEIVIRARNLASEICLEDKSNIAIYTGFKRIVKEVGTKTGIVIKSRVINVHDKNGNDFMIRMWLRDENE